ncbi:MAG: cysteine synthase family protein [Abditibacteriales bacterium]|nr:cysteine synthase family protein [Abditibacteriales bacterium]MDW8364404.1 cysteine synthase family protein [Abditibacteriales bacterium]
MAATKRDLDDLSRFPILQLIGNTPLIRVDLFARELPEVEILAKAEMLNPGGSIKDRPVLQMLTEAIRNERLTPRQTILDSTSGNAGIAYAMIGAALGYRVEMVMPGNASAERKKRIRAHGASIIFTDPLKGYDEALREVRRRYESDPERYFFCDQYSNADNWKAHYETTAVEILKQTGGRLTHFVAGVGTGGTITGIGRRLKEHNPKIEVWCVIPEEFPGVEGLKPLGHPGDIVPAIFDESVVDVTLRVKTEDAYAMSQRLAKQGLFVGQSSGAYLWGALQAAKAAKRGRIVTTFNDTGERYFSTGLWD